MLSLHPVPPGSMLQPDDGAHTRHSVAIVTTDGAHNLDATLSGVTPKSTVITTTNAAEMIFIMGGLSSIRCGIISADLVLQKAREDLGAVYRNRNAIPAWYAPYSQRRRDALERVARCRRYLAKCHLEAAVYRRMIEEEGLA